jgi:hypothetical protein
MIRNSFQIQIISKGSLIWLPWTGTEPDFTSTNEPTLSVLVDAWSDFLESGEELEIIPDPEPIPVVITPDWDGLSARVLGDDLLPIFTRVTVEAISSNPISIARGDTSLAVTVIKNELALASSLALLQQCGFVFTDEEKQLWNNVVTELGFSEIVWI